MNFLSRFFARGEKGPSRLQQEFIRAAAPHFRYLAFGDTDHKIPEIILFALHKKTVAALAGGGKSHYFLETGREAQAGIDALKEGRGKGHPLESPWFDAAGNERLRRTFERAVRVPCAPRFIAAGPVPSRDIGAGFSDEETIRMLMCIIEMQAASAAHQDFDPAAAMEKRGVTEDMMERFVRNLSNDHDVVRHIAGFPGPAAILYGSYHLAKNPDRPDSLRQILEKEGLCAINIYRDWRQYCEDRDADKADAAFFIDPPAGPGSGIRIFNPALNEFYRQAARKAGLRI